MENQTQYKQKTNPLRQGSRRPIDRCCSWCRPDNVNTVKLFTSDGTITHSDPPHRLYASTIEKRYCGNKVSLDVEVAESHRNFCVDKVKHQQRWQQWWRPPTSFITHTDNKHIMDAESEAFSLHYNTRDLPALASGRGRQSRKWGWGPGKCGLRGG